MIQLLVKQCAQMISMKVDISILNCQNLYDNKKFPHKGQGRLDGAFCDFSENDKMEYLNKLKDQGIVNIEMESSIFAALTHHAGIKAAIVCVALLNRLNGDQVCT